MPIDARIPLMVQPAQIDSPMEMAGNFLKLREMREISMQRMRDRQEDEQIRSIFQQSQGDMDGALPRIRQINPLKAAAIEETWTKSRKASAELQKLELERTGKLQELLSQELGNVTDQTSWDHYRAYATAVRHSANLPPPALDETYSPEKVEQYKLNGMALKDQIELKKQKFQAKEFGVGGQRVAGSYDPATGQYSYQGKAIEAPEATAAERSTTPESQAIAAAEKEKGAPLTSAELTALHGRWGKSDDRPRVSVTVGGGTTGGLVDAVMANPSLWSDLTPTIKSSIAPELQKRGFTGFGKGSKPATGAQQKNLGFFNQAKNASETLDALAPEIAKLGIVGQARLGAPSWGQTQLGQSYTQAQNAWTEARLRLVSGAVAPPSEYKKDRETYFAQPGDTAETIEQKNRARAVVEAGMAFGAGPALHEFYGDEGDTIISSLQAKAKGAGAPPPQPKPTATPAGGVQEWVRDPKTGKLRRKTT